MTCADDVQYLESVTWHRNNSTGSLERDGCKAFGILTNQTLYSLGCTGTSNFTVTLRKVSRAMHADTWKCRDIDTHESNGVTIFVKVKTKNADLLPRTVFTTSESGSFFSLQCMTNECRPEPVFLWYKDFNTSFREDDILLKEYIPSYNSNNTIKKYISTLDYKPNRTLNGWYIFCGANNSLADIEISNKILMNITYPPDTSPWINELVAGEEYQVNEGKSVGFSCSVTGGNPLPQIEWNRSGNESEYSDGITIRKTISWLASREDQDILTCTSIHFLNNETTSVKLIVLYGAKVINLFAYDHNNTEVMVVAENDVFHITCEIEGNPLPEGNLIYQGTSDTGMQNKLLNEQTRNTIMQTPKILSLVAQLYAKCTDAGQYTCKGWNKIHNGEKIQSDRSLMLFVKCKPRKSPYHEVIDGVQCVKYQDVTLSFTTLAYPVPPESGYVWYKKGIDNEWTEIPINSTENRTSIATSGLQSNLTIKKITQLDAGLYRLTVENEVGEIEHIFRITVESGMFQLGVEAIGVIGSAVLLVVILVFIAIYRRRSKGVKQKIISTSSDAKDEHIYQNCNAVPLAGSEIQEFTQQRENACFVHNTAQISRNRLSGALSLLKKEESPEETYVLQEFHHANIQELDRHENISELDRHANISELDHHGNIPEIDHLGDVQEQGHLDKCHKLDNLSTIQAQGHHGDYQDLCHVEGNQDLEIYEDSQELDGDDTSRADYGNSLEMVKKIERVYIQELFSYLAGTTKDYFEAQFMTLPKGLTKTYSFSQKPENIPLNRYHGIYPYDHSRVKIPDISDFFINACYIDGFEIIKTYIACLGPMANTTNNFVMFWQMVWSEKSDVIVMLTLLVEHSGVKCDQYWPNNGTSVSYGDFTVTSVEEDLFSDYVIRKFKITKDAESRNITHFHFTAWPDKSVPEDVTCLLEFRRRVRKLHSSGPLIVHCSAGIGRTGTLIAIDILTEEGRSQGSVNVLECVKKMREQRVNMVQTLEQYYYIYKTLVNALVFDNDAIPKEDFCKYTDISKIYNFSRMFQTFNQSVEYESTQESRARTVNTESRYGNRDGADVPGDAHRVRLFLSRELSSSDYINAVYVNSYTTADHFIVAQSPLPNSVEDFLCLIYQAECTCVVTMDREKGGQIAGLYLPPDNSNFTVGNFTVTCRRLDTKDCCIVRQVKIALNGMFKGAEKVVYHFQYTGWLDGHRVPSNPKKFVEFARKVENCFKQFGNENCHVLVHCLNAFERSCLFCAVVALTETVEHEGEVCIPNTLRRIRTRRRRAFPNMEQFRFCFQAVKAYTETDHEDDNTYMICY